MHLKLLLICLGAVYCDHHQRTNQLSDRSTIVHLFEWKYKDIADECERFLAPKGFGGVQGYSMAFNSFYDRPGSQDREATVDWDHNKLEPQPQLPDSFNFNFLFRQLGPPING